MIDTKVSIIFVVLLFIVGGLFILHYNGSDYSGLFKINKEHRVCGDVCTTEEPIYNHRYCGTKYSGCQSGRIYYYKHMSLAVCSEIDINWNCYPKGFGSYFTGGTQNG